MDDVSASFQDSPFIGCENLENASIIGFSELNFGTLIQGLSKLSSLVIDDECRYIVNDECFADNASLTEFSFGRNITIDRFSENALSAASLTSINLAGIKYDELTSIDKLEVQKSEDVV